jgi:hypothetical protein
VPWQISQAGVSWDPNGNWIDDIKKPITIQIFHQVLAIWEKVNTVPIHTEEEDSWSWAWDPKETFTSKSVYQGHFQAKVSISVA